MSRLPAKTAGAGEAPASALAAPINEAIVRLTRAHRAWAAAMLREVGLYPGQELLLMRLWETDRQAQRDLVRALCVDASTMTKMLQRLEQAGFVTREASTADRRAVIVSLTPAGAALQEHVHRIWADLEEHTLDGMNERERDSALHMLRQLEANLGHPDPRATEDTQ